ncbi:MAG: hypothetical protein H6850_03320 [Alphaproteobacteria bacterium]|nr:MAG: hypothetical protein H6850_03320 [Alphaproteobacteria bacterium]
MIYVTEGLQIDGCSVRYIHLRDLFYLMKQYKGSSHILIKNIHLKEGKCLNALPIHIDECDIPYLDHLDKLNPLLNEDVTVKIVTPLNTNDLLKIYTLPKVRIIDHCNDPISPQPLQGNSNNKDHSLRVFWIIFSSVALFTLLVFGFLALTAA